MWRTCDKKNAYHVLVRIIEGDYLEDLAVDGWLIFKYTVKEHVGCVHLFHMTLYRPGAGGL